MGDFAVAVAGGIPAPFVTTVEADTALVERNEDGGLGGVVMVLEGTIVVVSKIGAGPVTKGVENGPVPDCQVGDTV